MGENSISQDFFTARAGAIESSPRRTLRVFGTHSFQDDRFACKARPRQAPTARSWHTPHHRHPETQAHSLCARGRTAAGGGAAVLPFPGSRTRSASAGSGAWRTSSPVRRNLPQTLCRKTKVAILFSSSESPETRRQQYFYRTRMWWLT